MDINQNLEQINTFEKGMNTDTSDALLPNNQYRYAENLRFSSHDTNNAGELLLIRNLLKILKLDETIIASTCIRQYAIFITNSTEGWNIYRVDKFDTKPNKIFGPCTTLIGDNISLVSRWETAEDIKLYIADGLNPLMCINIVHKDGKQNNIEYVLSTNKIILLQPIVNISTKVGSLKPAVIQYTYRLYKEGGVASEFAPASELIYITKDDSTGYAKEETSNKSIDVSVYVDEINGLDKILIIRITYIENGQDPDILIIYDGDFSGNIKYNDTGINVSSISAAEFRENYTLDKIIPKVIESKGDYLFAANIKDYQDEIEELWKNLDFTELVDIKQTQSSRYKYKLNYLGLVDSSEIVPTLRPGEWYRYGIILYDKKGRKSTVKWVKDIYIQEQTPIILFDHNQYVINPIGIEVSVKNIPNCSRYEIVRCLRGINQTKVLYQGICGFPLAANNNAFANLFLSDTRTRQINFSEASKKNKAYTTAYDLLTFVCPEFVYLPDETNNVIKNRNISIKTNARYNINIQKSGLRHNNYEEANLFDSTIFFKLGQDYGISQYIKTGAEIGFTLSNDYDGFTLFSGSNVNASANYFKFKEKDITSYFCFIKPKSKADSNEYANDENINVSDYTALDSFKPSDRAFTDVNHWNDTEFIGADNYTYSVGNYTYKNWYMHNSLDVDGVFIREWNGDEATTLRIIPAGRAILFLLDSSAISGFDAEDLWLLDKENIKNSTIDNNTDYHSMFRIDVRDIINKDYIGYPSDKELLAFYSFGHIYNYDSSNHIIYDGDTYANVFIYNHTHIFLQQFVHQVSTNVIYAVPILSSINLLNTHGQIITRISGKYTYMYQDYAGKVYGYQQNKDAYLYNAAYNATSNLISYTPIKYTEVYSLFFDTRIKHSQQKLNGELIDNWTRFKSSSSIDVDTRFGEITHMRLFKDLLIFWLKNATGIVSVNERILIQDASDNDILLGTGGVLQRYDYITTTYGMQFKNIAETLSNTTLYWWDRYKKEILTYSNGLLAYPITEAKNIKTYINIEADKMTTGPCFVYDNENNEILMNVSMNPIVYNEYLQQFSSVYKYTNYTGGDLRFNNCIQFDDLVWVSESNTVYKLNAGNYLQAFIQYVVNKDSSFVKTYDNVRFGINLKSNKYSYIGEYELPDEQSINSLLFLFISVGQYSNQDVKITNREYDYRFAIPRSQQLYSDDWKSPLYGNRMRGKYLTTRITIPKYDKSDQDAISLQYIITKFRISYN